MTPLSNSTVENIRLAEHTLGTEFMRGAERCQDMPEVSLEQRVRTALSGSPRPAPRATLLAS